MKAPLMNKHSQRQLMNDRITIFFEASLKREDKMIYGSDQREI